MVHLTLLAAGLAFLPSIFAHPSPAEIFNREAGRNGCGTEAPPIEFLAAASELAAGDAKYVAPASNDNFRIAAVGGNPFETPIVVDTWIHVIAANTTVAGGYIPENQLTAQMEYLNESFGRLSSSLCYQMFSNPSSGPSNIQFVLKGVTRTVNAAWTVDVTGAELEYKTALRKGDYKTLNLYFLTRLRDNALGVILPTIVSIQSILTQA